MAKKKEPKKQKEKKTKEKVDKKSMLDDWKNKSIDGLKFELQRLTLAVKEGEESNTSLIKKLKKQIARLLTEQNKQK